MTFSQLITPAKAASKGEFDFSKPSWACERKLDGCRFLLYIGYDPYGSDRKFAMLSRRENTQGLYTDRAAQVPHLAKQYPGLEFTVLDGELMGADLPSTTSILLSNPTLAIQKQQQDGLLQYHAFDCIIYNGTDLRLQPLHKRRKVLEYVISQLANPHIHVVRQIAEGDLDQIFHDYTAQGGEGLILKNLNAAYGQGWIKLKKNYDFSTIVSGFDPGEGKYEGMVGSLLLSVYNDDGELIEIGKTSGFDDSLRAAITADPDRYLDIVVDVFAQELTPGTAEHPLGRLRHASFHRFREDMLPEHCTYQKLRDDLDGQARRNRERFLHNGRKTYSGSERRAAS